ncbi:AI-2E family transporter [Ornithinicoccus hortensis]|uniref:Putative PurR-regulated permease PerM n=1 Tax=Ornithinicoccus hortensis TaxID=82346 RepID=A0A542YSZ7_9MICO|nr:AI-2E family transporter [Ornithinicoccus hortensis]TQL51223.1 putative PurR-regulated permease PerM [Ornithinicoccus hortensis]
MSNEPAEASESPSASGLDHGPYGSPAPLDNTGTDRAVVLGYGFRVLAAWSGRFILIAIAGAILLWLLAQAWVGVFPVILALIVATVLWPPVAWLRAHRFPPALAAATALLGAIVLIVGVLASIAPSVVSQASDVVDSASEGLVQLREYVSGPPLELDNDQLDDWVDQAVAFLQGRASDIAAGVFTGVSAVGSGLVTMGLVLVLTFFFIKDGPNFLPWVRRNGGRTVGRHLTEVLTRVWRTLGGFIRTQAIVSAVDAIFIGIGLLFLQVPLALALAVLTFFGGFIPIVGAFVAGTLAVLVALVTNGWQTALAVLVLIIVVQQVEGNLLQPFLQGRSMKLHAAIILLAVAAGGTLFGIAGAFLAVPVAASLVVVLRYLGEQVDLVSGDISVADVQFATPEGALLAEQASQDAARFAEELGADDDPEAEWIVPVRQGGPLGWIKRLFGRG